MGGVVLLAGLVGGVVLLAGLVGGEVQLVGAQQTGREEPEVRVRGRPGLARLGGAAHLPLARLLACPAQLDRDVGPVVCRVRPGGEGGGGGWQEEEEEEWWSGVEHGELVGSDCCNPSATLCTLILLVTTALHWLCCNWWSLNFFIIRLSF